MVRWNLELNTFLQIKQKVKDKENFTPQKYYFVLETT